MGLNEADSETWHGLQAAASLPCPRRGSELADGCNSDDKQLVCGGEQPSHKVLEASTVAKEAWSLRCGHQDEAWEV